MVTKQYNEQQVIDLSARFNEPNWRIKQRKEALDKMQKLDLPRFERMPLNKLNLTSVDLTPYFPEVGNVYDFINTKTNQALLVQIEEQTVAEQLPNSLAQQGVIVTDLMTAFIEYEDLVKEHFMTITKYDENELTAYHSAFLTSGVFVYIPENVVVTEPIETLFMQEKDATSSFIKHVLIVAEKNSKCTYIEHLASANTTEHQRSGNMIVEIIAKDGAKVNYAAIDESAKNMDLYLERKAHLAKDASVDFAIGAMNKGSVMANLDVELIGDGATSNQKIVAISTDTQTQFIDTKANHYGKNSVADIMQRGVVLAEGDLRFNGIGHIYSPAKAAKTTQESRLMMMTANGRGDANPMLLIDHDEVVASHAASVGQMDIETLFYLMSRGLSEEQVIRMQTYAFLSPVMKAMPNKQIQEEIFAHLERALD